MFTQLYKLPNLLDVDEIVIENQPVLKINYEINTNDIV